MVDHLSQEKYIASYRGVNVAKPFIVQVKDDKQ